jgi:hypothetical protein
MARSAGRDTDVLVFVVALQAFQLQGTHQGNAAAGHHALLPRQRG